MSKRFRLSLANQRAMVFLGLVVMGVALCLYLIQPATETGTSGIPSEQARKEIADFEEALRRDSAEWRKRYAEKYKRGETTYEPETFPFDPNTSDSITFLRLGLRSWQAGNALKYRRKGGRWKSADDFSRLYGLSRKDFERLRPYIRIAPTPRELEKTVRQARYDSLRAARPHIEKFAEGTTIDINAADTNQLKRIPGIGSYYAQKICRYREALGGFVQVEQIAEIPDLPENMERWFFLKPTAGLPRKINVNKADFKTLVRHPYLNYEQVKEIVNYIRQHGPLRGWNDLRLSKQFTPKDFQRLTPYFSF